MYRVLVVADPLDDLNIAMDSTLRIVQEMLERDSIFEVFYCDYAKLNVEAANFLDALPASRVLHCDVNDANFFGLDVRRTVRAEDFDAILLRQDPPVDARFARCCERFAPIANKVLFVNDPRWIAALKEHILPTEYPDFSIPTTVCHSFEELISAVRAQRPEAVVKPENESSGIGIVFVDPQTPAEGLREHYSKYGPTVIVQPYLDEITKSGDLRVLFMNGQVLGSVLRVPQKGSRLANFFQGGTGAKQDPSPRQIEIAQSVGRDLMKKGIYFVGFDFIGDLLSEVNITSPTGMAQINALNGVRTEKDFNDQLLRLLDKRDESR
ncbi:MAG TPA: hypothetical protein VM901_03500 [Bdellovibrionota bacterium]|jgi:glutathione synthase|nr:hypothetical protein [Bdellovibrionota bacterium]